jgi:hypothetical protein
VNPKETVILTRYVKALCPQQKFDEFTPDAWHDVLGGYTLADARAAAASVAGQQPFVSPAEIIAEIKRQRGERAADFQGPGLSAAVPDADPDDVVAYLAALREQRTKAADGEELKPRPVAELISGIAAGLKAVPDEVAEVRRPGPLGIECPTCKAAIGRPCRTPGGKERAAHPHRTLLASGGTLPDPEEERREMERRRQASARRLAEASDAEEDEAS